MPEHHTYAQIQSPSNPLEKKRQNIAVGTVLTVLTLERLSYYALSATFYLFLNEGPWDKDSSWNSLEALNAVFILTGISYVSALIGGYLSDAALGRFKCILLGFYLYIAGFILLSLMSIDKLPHFVCGPESSSSTSDLPRAPCRALVYSIITILGIGAGLFRSNIAPFGAEQLRFANADKLRSFFNWFYWCINCGSFFGIGVITFIQQDNPGICTNGFFCGYMIATTCLTIAAILFACAYPWYLISPHEGSLLFDIGRIVWDGIKAYVNHLKYRRRYPDSNTTHVEPPFLDRAKIRYGGSFHEGAVDDVRALGKMLLVFTALIPYWLVYFQMETTFEAQGLHMRLSADVTNGTSLGNEWSFSVPAAWLTLFNQAFLFFAIPILSSFLYPRLERGGRHVSVFFRIGVGMLFSTLAVMTAGGLESYRLYLWNNDNSTHIAQVIGNSTYNAVDISVFWQIPQYILIGAAEAFASIAGLEYANSAAPKTFQGLVMGLFYSLEGSASFLGIALLHLVSPFWFNNMTDYANINDNHLDFYLYFLGSLQLITGALYCSVLYIRRFTLELVVMPTTGVGVSLLGQDSPTRLGNMDGSSESIDSED